MRARQLADLRRSATLLREMFNGIAVETYFARLKGTDPERVIFERV